MKSNLLTNEPDRGQSNIIGVILMIVVVVVLATAVLSFGLGFTDLLSKPPQAGVSVQENYHAPEDGGEPTYTVNVVFSAAPNADSITVNGPTTETTLTTVGEHATLHNLKKGDLIVITAKKDSETVVVRRHTVGSS